MKKEIAQNELDFLLRFPIQVGVSTPVDFLSNNAWGAIKVTALPNIHLHVNAPCQKNGLQIMCSV